jgi:hypothetical protein
MHFWTGDRIRLNEVEGQAGDIPKSRASKNGEDDALNSDPKTKATPCRADPTQSRSDRSNKEPTRPVMTAQRGWRVSWPFSGVEAVSVALVLAFMLFASRPDEAFGGIEELCGLDGVGAIVVQPDGKIVVCTAHGRGLIFVNERTGVFGRIRGGVVRFESNGSIDHDFRSELLVESSGSVFDWSLSLQPDGKLLARGQRDRIGRLTSDGRLDQTFSLQPAETNASPVWADLFVLKPCALGPAGEIVVRGVCPDFGASVTNGWDGAIGPIPVVHWFDSTGRFLHSSSWTERAPDLAAHLTSAGICVRRAHWFLPYGRKEKDIFYRPLEAPLEGQLADPALAALLRQVADELPLSLCRYAARLPDGGVVLAFSEEKKPGAGRLARFNREWQWDRDFQAHFELGHPANTLQLAWDQRGGL